MQYIWILATILLSSYGQVALKWRLNNAPFLTEKELGIGMIVRILMDPIVLSTFFAAFLASLTWIMALKKLPISFAYPFMAATFALVLISGHFFLGETVSSKQIISIALITAALIIGSSA